jgi:YbbR domain-containing protein
MEELREQTAARFDFAPGPILNVSVVSLSSILRRAFLENAALKAVAFVLAVTLFILVRGDKETERSVRVGVAYIKPQDRVAMGELPDGVDVWVRGPWTRIRRLDPSEVDPIVVDLTKLQDGEFTIEESMIRLPAGLRVATIRPARINIQFEHLKKLPVVPEPVGVPPEGFVVERIVTDPPAVTVRGSKATTDLLSDARTLPVSVMGKRKSFHQVVPLAPLPKGLSTDVDSVDVEVQIAEDSASRTLTDLPVALQPPAGARVAAGAAGGLAVEPAQVTVTLRGPRKALSEVDDGKVAAVVEVRLDDYAPGRSRQALVVVEGTPPGVAVDVSPREVTLVMRPPGK